MSTGSVQDMTLSESINYLNDLINKYSDAEKHEQQIADNEARLSGPSGLNNKTYSFFRFFWLYLVIAILSWYPFWLIAIVVDDMGKNAIFWYAMDFIAPIVILIIGCINGGRQFRKNNASIKENNENIIKQREKLEADTAVLKSSLADKKIELDKESGLIPENLRKSAALTQMETLLKSGTASNLQEAIDILRDSF